jgi:chitinase
MNRKRFLLFYILIACLLLNGCPSEEPGPKIEDDDDKPFILGDATVAAYLSTWSNWTADSIKGEYLSDIIIAFALIDKTDGYSLYMPDGGGLAPVMAKFAAIKAKHPHIKVTVSVGGATESGFSAMAADANKRAGFVANVCNWLKIYDLDGVDIDWEYPVRPLSGGANRPQDRGNYITLLRELRAAMDELGGETGKQYKLSTAVPAQDWFVTSGQGVDIKTVSEIVDGLKLMAYDYNGSWNNTTGHNANLNRGTGIWWSTHDAVTAYISAQVRPEKIIMGVAFYGQAWNNVGAGNNANLPGLNQSGAHNGTPSWTSIKGTYLKPDSPYARYWDSNAKAPFLYNGSHWISYTDHEQIKEIAAYAKTNKLGGLFAWEYAHDMEADLLKTMAESSW